MIYIFQKTNNSFFVVGSKTEISAEDKKKLSWLFSGAEPIEEKTLEGKFVGPRKEMITPWSTNAVEITQNRIKFT